jgi:hypothetical protein
MIVSPLTELCFVLTRVMTPRDASYVLWASLSHTAASMREVQLDVVRAGEFIPAIEPSRAVLRIPDWPCFSTQCVARVTIVWVYPFVSVKRITTKCGVRHVATTWFGFCWYDISPCGKLIFLVFAKSIDLWCQNLRTAKYTTNNRFSVGGITIFFAASLSGLTLVFT